MYHNKTLVLVHHNKNVVPMFFNKNLVPMYFNKNLVLLYNIKNVVLLCHYRYQISMRYTKTYYCRNNNIELACHNKSLTFPYNYWNLAMLCRNKLHRPYTACCYKNLVEPRRRYVKVSIIRVLFLILSAKVFKTDESQKLWTSSFEWNNYWSPKNKYCSPRLKKLSWSNIAAFVFMFTNTWSKK